MILDVDSGLYIGLAFSLLLVILHSQRTMTSVMGNIPHTDIYETCEACEDAREIENIRILRFESSLYYANVDNFLYKIAKNSSIEPKNFLRKLDKLKEDHEKKLNKKLKEQV
jgi:MFS superfamily sulfate permease-like transporter